MTLELTWVDLASLLTGVAAVGGLIYARRGDRRQELEDVENGRSEAREEATALAETRGRLVEDLRNQIREIRDQAARDRQHADKTVARLEEALAESRREAHETQRLLLVGFRGALLKLIDHLETSPPQVEAAIAYVREMLADAPPLRIPARPPRP